MDLKSLSDRVREELLALCQKEQAQALAEGRSDAPDCGCLGTGILTPPRWLFWF